RAITNSGVMERIYSNERRSDYNPALGTVDLTTLKDAGAEGLSILNRPIFPKTLAQAKENKEQSVPINRTRCLPSSSQQALLHRCRRMDVFAQLAYLRYDLRIDLSSR
ncbi:hypothetical protein LTR49_009501, partial [Elasticomyces elasticus]